MSLEIKNKSSEKRLVSKTQGVFLAVVLIIAGVFVLDRQFGWLGVFYREPVAIPSGTPYAEGAVIGVKDGAVLAERILPPDTGKSESILSKKLEILTDEKTVFAKLTSSGPIKISRSKISEGDIIWIYNRVRTLEETLKEPADPELAIPFEEMLKNPRERTKADFVVLVSEK